MIIVRSPYRLPIAGGGTDLDFYYKKRGGDLISASINQYMYILISKIHKYFSQLLVLLHLRHIG